MATSNEEWNEPTADESAILKQKVQKEGKSGVKAHLDQWKEIPVNIAITGNSGSGKSSFINAVRGLTADDEGAAAVDVVETTSEPTSYEDPNNPMLLFWDLPGVGTHRFKRDTYLNEVQFENYDFFLIVCRTRFTENDMWLAKEVLAQNKKFFFIRTCIEEDFKNDKRAHPRTHDQHKCVSQIRGDCEEQLRHAGITKDRVFLIDNYNINCQDFGKLSCRLIEDLPELKREAMILSLSVLTDEVIEKKRATLNKRIWIVSLVSAGAAAVPIPVLGEAVDVGIILEEALFYRKQFQLDDASLKIKAAKLHTSLEKFKTKSNLAISTISFTIKGIMRLGVVLGVSAVVENVFKFVIPVLGSLISAGVSYGSTVAFLRHLLNKLVGDAVKINTELKKIIDT